MLSPGTIVACARRRNTLGEILIFTPTASLDFHAHHALWALRTWLDSWSGIGHVTVGMARQGYDLQLTRYDEKGWRATFYTTGIEHSPTGATGTGWEQTSWRATRTSRLGGLEETGRLGR
jgi:hypothetical protein